MNALQIAAIILMAACAIGIGAMAVLYPALLWLTSFRDAVPPPAEPGDADLPPVSLIIAVRNGAGLIEAKLANAAALDYPPDRLEIIVSSDGSDDGTDEIVRACPDDRVRLVSCPEHGGKAKALNRAVEGAAGRILVFSDVDAILEPPAVRRLVGHFGDAGVGGVCGQRVIGEAGGQFAEGQRSYITLDSRIKALESRRGSITSNDGKLHAIRRELFSEIPDGVTDDLYTCLSVVAQGARFVFEPGARAVVRLPSRGTGHELARRRRIVARSLRGIMLRREVLNPLRFGRFAIGLLVNKVLRRLMPIFHVGLLASSAVLAIDFPWARVFLVAQLAVAAIGLSHLVVGRSRLPSALRRATASAYLFVIGNVGTFLGFADCLRNKSVTRWNPVKADG